MPKKKLITSALPYVNNEPHLGNIIGCVLSADCYARFCRSKGYETLYICGTDEYGTATETKAAQEGLSPREICDKYHDIHAGIYEHFNISFDAFGRTSTPEHTEIVQWIFSDVEKNDKLVEVHSEQLFCPPCDKFLADRLVSGTCPKCHYEDAKGDQCDSCGSMLNPTELISPACSVCKTTPELRKTKHLHLDLPGIQEQLKEFQEQAIEKGHWPVNARTTTRSWMVRKDEETGEVGLRTRAITRDLKWGVPVPRADYSDKVFYVWFDAPIGYVSITRQAYPDTWKDWWLAPKTTDLYQFMAKDNIPFHSIIFPATQLASGEDWTKVHHLSSTEYLNYEDSKFSKSRNVGVFGSDVINSGIPVDLWRYYLLAIRPERQDSAFTWQEFFDKVNNEFLDNIGNLVNRVTVYNNKNFDGKIELGSEVDAEQQAFVDEAKAILANITEAYEKVSIREAIRLIMTLGALGNKFFQEQEPWLKIKTDKDNVQSSLALLLHLVRDIAVTLAPIMPETSERICAILGCSEQTWASAGNFSNLEGSSMGKPEILFAKLDTDKAESFRKRFGGDDAAKLIDLRAGKILEVEEHPNAGHLYVLKVDLGEAAPRTICSGLTKHCTKEDLLGKTAVIVTNLSPVDLSGIESNGMVLTVSKKKTLEVLDAGDAPAGSRILRDFDKTDQRDLISIDQFKQVALRVKEGVLTADGDAMSVNENPITTSGIQNGKVS